ncbi:MAG: aldehyde dehydrogenase family protein [Alphaproteobacteria bacterium]
MSFVETQLFIGGEPRAASGGATYAVHNPARLSEQVGAAAAASIADVEQAIAAASGAFISWSSKSVEERADALLRVADVLSQDEDDIDARKRLLTREHGKVLFEADIEIRRIADRFRQVSNFAAEIANTPKRSSPQFDTLVTRKARGVSTLIVPWNWPLAILGAKLPQALLAGNTVVVKLANFSPLATAQTVSKIAAALPPGVVNLVTGDGVLLGDTLTGHPDVKQVNFTGSVRVGKMVMAQAAQNLTPVTLELGGNDAGILLDDVDLSGNAFQRLFLATFLTTGQICMAMKRMYVHRSRFDEVVEGFTAFLNAMQVGDGLEEGVRMGPVNNRRQYDVVRRIRDEAQAAGADLRAVGQMQADENVEETFFLRPYLAINADPSLSVVHEEQFGPILPIVPFDTEEEALAMANDSEFGLSSSVWSADNERAVSVARQIEAGFTNINSHGPTAMDGLSPFGGVKNSGLGRNFGIEGVMQFQEYHSISGPTGSLG